MCQIISRKCTIHWNFILLVWKCFWLLRNLAPLLLSTMCLLVERFRKLFESLRIDVFSFYSISTRMASLIYLSKTSASVQNFTLESFWSVKRFVLLMVSFVIMKLQDKRDSVTVGSGTVLLQKRARCIVLHETFLS